MHIHNTLHHAGFAYVNHPAVTYTEYFERSAYFILDLLEIYFQYKNQIHVTCTACPKIGCLHGLGVHKYNKPHLVKE